jgi:hypothetical protein
VRLKVSEHFCYLSSSRKETREDFLGHLMEREVMALLIQRIDDFVELQEISDERQILAMACLVRVGERSGDHGTKFRNVAHVDASHSWVKRERPARGSVGLFLWTKNADKVLIVERRDDERMIRKPGFSHYAVNLGLTSKVGNVKLAFADGFDVWQRGPDQVFDAGIPGGVYGSGGLLQFGRSVLLEVGYQKYAMRPTKCGCQGFGTIQVCFDDFVGELAMLGRMASQGAYLELIAGSNSAYYSASLLPRCADYGDHFLVGLSHVQCASLSHYLLMPVLLI